MALFGLACPMCILLIISLLLYIQYGNIEMVEKFNNSDLYYPDHCKNLDFTKCLQTTHCGWLLDSDNSRCLQGTAVGPLNQNLQPDAENSIKGNIQYDRWIYSDRNPFIFC